MDEKRAKHISKFMSLVLRHAPHEVGIALDPAGWVAVDELLGALAKAKEPVTLDDLKAVVAASDKQRFAFSEDGARIRANQGHSVAVELGYEPAQPPEILYHGTPMTSVEKIRVEGLKKMERHAVHLSESIHTTMAAASRRGKPMLLRIRAAEMARDGFTFTKSPNGVWLVDHVPAKYLMLGADLAGGDGPAVS